MRCKLTQTSQIRKNAGGNKRLVSTYEWRGMPIEVCDSARNVLLMVELFGDEDIDPYTKQSYLLQMLFFDPACAIAQGGDDMRELIEDVMWDVCALDVTTGHIHADGCEDPAFDWEEDAARIRASLLSAYGIDWDASCEKLSYSAVCDLLGALLEADSNTPFQQAIHFRRADPPKRNKHNGEYVDSWLETRDYFALKGAGDPIDAQAAAMADMFAAAEKEAAHG